MDIIFPLLIFFRLLLLPPAMARFRSRKAHFQNLITRGEMDLGRMEAFWGWWVNRKISSKAFSMKITREKSPSKRKIKWKLIMVTLFFCLRFPLKYQQAANRSTHKLTHHVQQRIQQNSFECPFSFLFLCFVLLWSGCWRGEWEVSLLLSEEERKT